MYECVEIIKIKPYMQQDDRQFARQQVSVHAFSKIKPYMQKAVVQRKRAFCLSIAGSGGKPAICMMKHVLKSICFFAVLACAGSFLHAQDAVVFWSGNSLPENVLEAEKDKADSLIGLVSDSYFSQGSYAAGLVRELYAIAYRTKDADLFVQSVYWDALVEYSQHNDQNRLASRIDSLMQIPALIENPHNLLLLNYASALSNLAYGNFPASFRRALEAYRRAVELEDRKLVVETATTLGNIGPYIQDYELSRHYYKIALQQCPPGTRKSFQIEINYSRLLFLEEKYDSAAMVVRNVLPDVVRSNDSSMMGVCYLNLGSYIAALGERDSAYRLYMEGLGVLQNTDNNNVKLVLLGNIGNYFRYKGNYEEAARYYSRARKIALDDSNMNIYASIAYELSVMFAQQGLTDSSYVYLQEYSSLDSRIQQPQTLNSYKDYMDMVMELSENQIQLSEQAASLKAKQMIIITLTSSAIILVLFLLWLVAVERRRSMRQMVLLKEIENKELSDQLGHEQEIKKLQDEKMDQKIREITSYSLLLANKNNLLKEIESLAAAAGKETGNHDCLQIKRLVDDSLHMDGDYWQQFVGHFTQVNPHFFDNLKQKFPDLTANEIKLCAYIRIGMSSKQIAQMLNLSPESVNKNRYRLRKKLGMEKDEALDELIAGL